MSSTVWQEGKKQQNSKTARQKAPALQYHTEIGSFSTKQQQLQTDDKVHLP